MNIKLLKISIFFITLAIIFSSCTKYQTYETDDYIIKLPVIETNIKPDKDSTEYTFTKSQTLISTWVVKKNIFEFTPNNELNDCIAKELSFFIKGRKSENIITENTQINGFQAVEVSGTDEKGDQKYYWTFVVIPTKYFFYIIRIYSPITKHSFNEYFHQKIINSFYLKNVRK